MEKKIVDSRKIVDAIFIFLAFAILIVVVIVNIFSNRVPTKAHRVGGFGSGDVLELIDSVDELKAVCYAHDVSAFNFQDPDYDSDFNKMVRKYDEKFFEKKSLIIYTFVLKSTGTKSSLEGVYKEGDVLMVDVVLFGGNNFYYGSKKEGWFIEVKKSDIEGTTRVELKSKD